MLDGVLQAVALEPAEPPHGWPWPRRRGWLRRMVILVWSGLAVGWWLGSVFGMIEDWGISADLAWSLGLLQGAPLVVALRWPIVAWRFMAPGLLGGVLALAASGPDRLWPWQVNACLAMVLVLFQVAASYERVVAVGAGVVTALGVVLPGWLAGMPLWIGIIVWVVLAALLTAGDGLGRWLASVRGLRVRVEEQEELRRRDLARQAVLEERGRIARELHDVVAHHMSMIAIQAEAAPHKASGLPPQTRETLAAIQTAAREALAETRRVVGLLREDDESPERLPQPGLDRLDDLLESAKQSGLDVEAAILGIPRALSAGVDLSAYRIVQEALSNAARYAPRARVRVEIGYGGEALRVAVTDDGAASGSTGHRLRGSQAAGGRSTGASPPAAEPGGGHGLVGMRERVAMLGGTLTAGPRGEGGFTVDAELPYGE